MGCIQSSKVSPGKSDTQKKEQLTAAPTVTSDPRLPINARQVFRLKQSWKGIRRNMESTGIEMFIKLFESNEKILPMFKAFKESKSMDELRVHPELEAHALRVMGVLDEIVTVIDKVDDIYNIIIQNAQAHRVRDGFTGDLFWYIEQPFLHSVQLTLGDRYTESMEEIYKIVIKFLLQCFEKAAANKLTLNEDP